MGASDPEQAPGEASGSRARAEPEVQPIEVVRGRQTNLVLGFRTVILADPSLGVLSQTAYMVRYANGKHAQGRTDGRGRLRVRTDCGDYVDVAITSRVKTRSRRVMLTQAPTSTSRGAWARLVNLGYVDAAEPPVEPQPEQLEAALRRFQVDLGLQRTGRLDPLCQQVLAREGDTP